MPTLSRIRVMISSRCEAAIPDGAGKPVKLSEVRRALKKEWEAVRLLDDSPLFEVWINEEEPVVEAAQDLWEKCLQEVRDADIVLAIYTGESGWVKAGGTIGICHAEFHEGWSKTPAKVFPINVEPAAGMPVSERDAEYREYFEDKQVFGSPVRNAKELHQRCNEALRAAISIMVKLGKFEARKGSIRPPAACRTRAQKTEARPISSNTIQQTQPIQMSLKDKLQKTGARKLLACDGGGIRGIIAVEILARIEADLRAGSGKPNLVLADYFDYVAGTSTGAIIATLVALGFSMEKIREFYLKSGAEMFEKAKLWERFRTKFSDDKLSAMLRDILGKDTQLGSEKLQTLLLVVLRNATTDSPWPLSNNPLAKYNDRSRPDCNLLLPLWQLVRASTAAPTYFPPERVVIGTHDFVFVDGGVTMYNNPAFQLFLMATSESYRLCWPTGEDRMLIVSVGTGASANAKANLSPEEMNLLYNAGTIPSALMAAALHEQDFLCRTFGRCLAGDPLDREVGTVIGQGIKDVPKLFTYARYNAELSREGLDALGLPNILPAHVQQMDSVEHIAEMQQVGRAVAAQKVIAAHLAGFPAYCSGD